MMGLVAARNPDYDPLLRRGRQFLISQQVVIPIRPRDGGVGYGDHGPYSDMNNTMHALEALYYSKHLTDTDTSRRYCQMRKELNCERRHPLHSIVPESARPTTNIRLLGSNRRPRQGWLRLSARRNQSRQVHQTTPSHVALRSYGSISYAGLLSYIYADLQHDDPRVQAAFDWLRNNYTLDENPGMGAQGLYYYLHLMTKALAIYGVDQLPVADGRAVDWRREVALKLINLQKADGSWANDNGRWWEKDPALVTSYSLMSLELLYPSL